MQHSYRLQTQIKAICFTNSHLFQLVFHPLIAQTYCAVSKLSFVKVERTHGNILFFKLIKCLLKDEKCSVNQQVHVCTWSEDHLRSSNKSHNSSAVNLGLAASLSASISCSCHAGEIRGSKCPFHLPGVKNDFHTADACACVLHLSASHSKCVLKCKFCVASQVQHANMINH